MLVYAIDVDNMEAYSSHDHFILKEVYLNRKDAVAMLEGKGFKPVHDKWRGETVWRWDPDEYDEYGCKDYSDAPFIETFNGVQATIIKCEVVLRG